MTDPISLVPSSHTIHNLNIISSTKIHQKVNQVLRIFSVVPPTTTAQANQDNETATTTPDSNVTKRAASTIVELKAKANVASKLISIVEILKRDLAAREKKRLDSINNTNIAPEEERIAKQKGLLKVKEPKYKLYQYTTITTTRIEVKPKAKPPRQKTKKAEPSQALEQEQPQPAEQDDVIDQVAAQPDEPGEQGQKRKRPADSSQDSTAAAHSPSKKTKLDEHVGAEEREEGELEDGNKRELAMTRQAADEGELDDTEEEADGFEEMRPKTAGKDTKPEIEEEAGLKQERDVPVLTIYLSMTPVAELAAAYTEQAS